MPHQQCHSFCYLVPRWVTSGLQGKPILALDMHEKPVPSWPGEDSVSAGKRHHVTGARAASGCRDLENMVSCISRQLCVVFAESEPAEQNYVDSETKWRKGPGEVWGAGIFPRTLTGTFDQLGLI